MLDAIRNFFDDHLKPKAESGDDDDKALALASGALFFEVMRADKVLEEAERATVMKLLESSFDLDRQELEEVASLAEQEAEEATDLYQFTRLVKEHYGEPGRVRLLRKLWKVAWADGHVDHYEEYVIRQIAELLHLHHHHFIRTKHEAREAQVG